MDEQRFFYAAPTDVGDPESWQALAGRLRQAVKKACGHQIRIDIRENPIFAPGVDGEQAISEFEELEIGWREVRIEPWCAYPSYSTVCLTLGNGFVRKHFRDLKFRMRKIDKRMTLIHSFEGEYLRDYGRVYGFDLSPLNPQDAATLEFLMIPYDEGPLYIGETWLLQGEDESIDESKFTIYPAGPDLAIFEINDDDAEETAWKHSAAGFGLIAYGHMDPAEAHLKLRFKDRDDLRVFLADSGRFDMRVALNRTPEAPVVVYDTGVGPEIDSPILFMI